MPYRVNVLKEPKGPTMKEKLEDFYNHVVDDHMGKSIASFCLLFFVGCWLGLTALTNAERSAVRVQEHALTQLCGVHAVNSASVFAHSLYHTSEIATVFSRLTTLPARRVYMCEVYVVINNGTPVSVLCEPRRYGQCYLGISTGY